MVTSEGYCKCWCTLCGTVVILCYYRYHWTKKGVLASERYCKYQCSLRDTEVILRSYRRQSLGDKP
jgi:hypothetical protein